MISLLSGLSAPGVLSAKIGQVQPSPTGAVLQLAEGRLQIEFITDRIARVRATQNADWSKTASLMRVEVAGKPGRIRFADSGDVIELRSSKLIVRVDRATEAVSYFDADGKPLLAENPARPRVLEKIEVIKSVADPATITKVRTVDGEREVAGKFIQTKDRDAWKGAVAFRFAEGEALYGLGFDETADLNLRGTTRRLYQHNLRIVIPSLVSTRGYGLLFDAYSAMTFADGADGGSLGIDVVDDLDYYFIAGPDMDGAVAGYRQLTGAASMLPRWAYGYVQSKERYKSQAELVATVKEFRDRKIPLDTIVQDWSYWRPGHWGGEPDPQFYPDIAAMTEAIHAMNAHVMISIWPNPDGRTPAGKTLQSGGYTLAGTSYVNMFDPAARAQYWKIMWEHLGRHGIDAWWCDSTEPEVADWQRSRPENPDETNIQGLAKIIDPQLLNAYALEDSKGIFENSRKASPDRRVVNLSRSGYAGSQRTGSVLWTGDISAKWSTLAQEVASLQRFSASGHPYVTTDTGAFFVKRGHEWFRSGDYAKGVEDLGYRELYTRWFQFSAFLPMFRSHGTDTPREPWRFGEPGTPFYDTIIATLDLRYRLLPYLYSQAGLVAQQDASFLRPVAFAYPKDVKTHDLKTQFLVGDALMVAPVLAPMYYGVDSTPLNNVAKTRDIYLPEGSRWVDFWTGQPQSGGRTFAADAPLARAPLLVRAGTILPLGPRVQYTDEKPGEPIELRVYPGADGAFSFYEDAGEGFGYERKEFSIIPMSWNNRSRTLKIGARRGDFPGMIKDRVFRVVLVRPGQATGIEPALKTTDIRYSGRAVAVRL